MTHRGEENTYVLVVFPVLVELWASTLRLRVDFCTCPSRSFRLERGFLRMIRVCIVSLFISL